MINPLKKIEKTRVWPLRVIGNFCGGFAGNHLFKAMLLDEDEDHGWRYKYHGKMWVVLNKPYSWWGTYYMIDTDAWKKDLDDIKLNVSGQNWDDYDEDGIAYWEKDE